MKSLVRAGQVLGLASTVLVATVMGAGSASAAAAPPNDTIENATAITSLPFTETVDTTEATTDAEDAAINADCGAPATNGSVWYTFVAGDAPGYVIDISQSDFPAGAIVATGTPGNLEIYACGPQAIGFPATPGETYYVMAFSDNPDVVGGQLTITVRESGPVPKIGMTIDDEGAVDRETGVATVSGTYTCDGEADLTLMQGSLQQQQPNNVQVTGSFEQEGLACAGTYPWSVDITPDSGKFRRGDAATIALTVGCNLIGCNQYQTLEVVRLR